MRRYLSCLGLVLVLLASLANLSPTAAASSLSLTAPSTLTGGKNLTVTIRLPKAAPAGGTMIELTSSDRGVAPIPRSVTISARRTSASVSVRTASVDGATAVTLTALAGGVERSVKVSVVPAKLTTLSIPSSIVAGTADVRGTVSRNTASSFPLTVTLTSRDPSVVSVPASVTIKAGASNVRFPVTTVAGKTGTVSVSATADGQTVTDSTKVVPAQISRVAVTGSMKAGASATAKVYLTGPAPVGGLTVALSSSDGATLRVPATVTVAQGQVSGSFTATAGSPSVATKVTITARLDGVAQTKSTTVNAGAQPVTVASVDKTANSVVSGDSTTMTVTLTKAATSATTVQLTGGAGTLGVPASVVVAAGKTSAAFTVVAGAVTRPTEGTVTATLGGVSKKTTITVLPATLVSVEAPAEIGSGSSVTGTISLVGIAPAGAVVTLESSEPKLVQVPEAVELVNGASSAIFTITTGNAVEAVKFEIRASYADSSVTVTGVLLAAPAVGPAGFDPARFTFVPDTETVLTLLLSGPAPADGLTIELGYSEGVSGEGKVWVEPGASMVTVAVWIKTGVGTASVTAYANDMKAGAEGTPAETTATLSVERAEVVGGDAVVITVTLSAPAGPDGLSVVIASDNEKLVPAEKVFIAAGESSATVKIATGGVRRSTTVTLSLIEGPAARVTVTLLPNG